MAIIIKLGNIGSGKTATAVREIFLNPTARKYYSNIKIKDNPNCIELTSDMLIKKEQVKEKRDGSPVYKLSFNAEFWQKREGTPCSIVIDEAHLLGMNSRQSMSSVNRCMNEFLSMGRRIMQENDSGTGDLIIISQLFNAVDVNCRNLANRIEFHKAWYVKECQRCHSFWTEHSEMPEPLHICPRCESYKVKRKHFMIEVFKFKNAEMYELWQGMGADADATRQYCYSHFWIKDIMNYFGKYKTTSWDNLTSLYNN